MPCIDQRRWRRAALTARLRPASPGSRPMRPGGPPLAIFSLSHVSLLSSPMRRRHCETARVTLREVAAVLLQEPIDAAETLYTDLLEAESRGMDSLLLGPAAKIVDSFFNRPASAASDLPQQVRLATKSMKGGGHSRLQLHNHASATDNLHSDELLTRTRLVHSERYRARTSCSVGEILHSDMSSRFTRMNIPFVQLTCRLLGWIHSDS